MKKFATEFRKKTINELEKEQENLRIDIAKLKVDWSVNKPKNTNLISIKRKKLAVLMSVLYEKKELEKLKVK